MTAADLLCCKMYVDEWDRIQMEGEIVRSKLQTPSSFIRLGDGELNILRRQDYLSDRLRAAVAACDILGLPDAFNRRPHPWRASLIEELPAYDGPVVSAILPLCLPSLLPSVLKGRRALWITHRAEVIIRRLKDPAFCEFYGFETGREDARLNGVPRGRTLPYVEASEAGYLGVLEKVCREADAQTYDVAVIGMGAIGKMVARPLLEGQGRLRRRVHSLRFAERARPVGFYEGTQAAPLGGEGPLPPRPAGAAERRRVPARACPAAGCANNRLSGIRPDRRIPVRPSRRASDPDPARVCRRVDVETLFRRCLPMVFSFETSSSRYSSSVTIHRIGGTPSSTDGWAGGQRWNCSGRTSRALFYISTWTP